jgi:uncharacterized protein YdhG (YjbR/CyaY superfamily)
MAKNPKLTYENNEEEVNIFMEVLEHPLKDEVQAVRKIIKTSSDVLCERIKWAAPSYYFDKTDLVTFNLRSAKHVMLVFHNIAIVSVQSELLQGEHKDRRMLYFNSMDDIKVKKPELERIIKEYVALAQNAVKKTK